MLAANEAVAEFLLRKKARTLYRVHEPPEPASVRELLDAARGARRADAAVPGRRGRAGGRSSPRRTAASAASSPRRAPARAAAGSPGRTLLLRSLKQARYAPAQPRATSASPARRTCTSPRRSAATRTSSTHRSLLYHLGEGGGELGEAELADRRRGLLHARARALAASSSTPTTSRSASCSSAASQAEGWEQAFAGEIVGLVGGGLFVRFGGVFEGFLSSRRLGGERFEVSEHETALVGEATGRRYRLGDAVDVKVERVDRLRGKVDLRPALDGHERPLSGGTRPRRAPPAAARRAAARPAASTQPARAADRRRRGGAARRRDAVT